MIFKRKYILLLITLLISELIFAQVRLCSWNIKDLGQSKNATEIEFMAETLRDCDVVAIQEVVAGPGGSQAVAKLADELNRKGAKWDYRTSNPTRSSPYTSERYAYLWKTSSIKLVNRPKLDDSYIQKIEREPFIIELVYNDKPFILFNFHALPKSKQPEREIKYFKFYPSLYTNKKLIFLGDFNVPSTHTVFNPLKSMGYKPVFIKQKTTLRTRCINNDCLASPYDNIILNDNEFKIVDFGVFHFYNHFQDLQQARKISDHIPVWVEIDFK